MTPHVKAHWTPRYLVDRVALAGRQRRHPDEPWLTATAIAMLDDWVRPTDHVLEWGSGRSTLWFASRASSVHTTEHDAQWSARVGAMTAHHANIHLATASEADPEAYVRTWTRPAADAFDLALIDGIHRDRCALEALEVTVPGGIIVVDNVERYIPSSSRSPEAIRSDYESEAWERFAAATTAWHRIWTTNGVHDTAFWFVPPTS